MEPSLRTQLPACFGYWGAQEVAGVETPGFHNGSEEFGLTASEGGIDRLRCAASRTRERLASWPELPGDGPEGEVRRRGRPGRELGADASPDRLGPESE